MGEWQKMSGSQSIPRFDREKVIALAEKIWEDMGNSQFKLNVMNQLPGISERLQQLMLGVLRAGFVGGFAAGYEFCELQREADSLARSMLS